MSGEQDDVPSYLVLDLKNKPFGAVLPVEIQNRIMWMSMKMVHEDSYKNVMQELRTLPVCKMVDWCGVVNATKPFRHTCSGCTECDHTDEQQFTCHWCRLYVNDQTSLYQQEVSRKLNEQRSAIGCYEEQKYSQFVQANRQRYAECIQYSFLVCALPMLCHVNPRDQHTNLTYIRQEVTFTEVELSLFVGITAFATLNDLKSCKNPRSYSEEPYKKLQGVNKLENAMRYRPPSEEEIRDRADDIMMQVYENVEAFLNEQD